MKKHIANHHYQAMSHTLRGSKKVHSLLGSKEASSCSPDSPREEAEGDDAGVVALEVEEALDETSDELPNTPVLDDGKE